MMEALQKAAGPLPEPTKSSSMPKPRTSLLRRIFRKQRLLLGITMTGLAISIGIYFLSVVRDARLTSTPLIFIEKIGTQWKSLNELEILLAGKILSTSPRRVLVEMAIYNP